MVTHDILEAFRPTFTNSDCLMPKQINFGKEILDIINNSWKNYAINKNANTDKNNNIPTIIPENHPYRYMLFDYIPKEDIKKWNDKHEENQNNNKNFVELLFTEYSKK